MSGWKVLVTDYVFESFDQEREILDAIGAELTVMQCTSVEELKPHLKGVHGLLNTYLAGIGAEVFDAAPDLKAVVRYGIGLDTIDVDEAGRRGITVANVPDYCIDEVADHALAHFLCCARKLLRSDRKVRQGEWSLSYVKPLQPLNQMRAGIVGFGRIGQAIAERLKPFGLEVVFFDPALSETTQGCNSVSFDELLETSDVVFVQCPSNKATYHLFGSDVFTRMKKRPILVNCARGAIVDTDALVQALRSGQVRAAGLDLLEDERVVMQDDAHPLRHLDSVVLTPHSAWFSNTAIPTLQRRGAEEMVRALTGAHPG
jgi:D-3-phosphoglycerate dehydrogenase / 2-oxoglutarate reductase